LNSGPSVFQPLASRYADCAFPAFRIIIIIAIIIIRRRRRRRKKRRRRNIGADRGEKPGILLSLDIW
jgi:hypothetical protein